MRFTLLALSLALAGCGGLKDADGITYIRTLGPGGGELTSEDGRFVLVIPEGALDREVTFTLEQAPFDHPQVVGKLYTIDPPIELRAPASVRFTHEAEPDGYVNEPGFFRFEDGAWAPVSDRRDGGTLLASLDRLGAFCAWVACDSSWDCETGFVCDTAVGACEARPECGAEEICGNERDDDCRGGIDDGCAECDERNPCADNEVCVSGTCQCASDVEICGDGLDNDCNDITDDPLVCEAPCPMERICGDECCTGSEYCVNLACAPFP